MKRPVPPVRGRGGLLIVVDESKAGALSEAITGPMPEVETVSDWSDRFLDLVDTVGLYVLAGVIAAAAVGLIVVGVLRAAGVHL